MAVLAVAAVGVGAAYTETGAAGPSPSTAAAATHLAAEASTPVPSSGCNLPGGPAVTDQLQGLVVGGTPRWYLLTTPAPGTPSPSGGGGAFPGLAPRPLVLDFHGVAEAASLQSETSRFGSLGQQDGFVVVTPSGTGDPVHWDTTDPGPSNPDLGFVTTLLDHVEATQCIDTSRVYATGFSDGAVMASQLACTLSQRITAIGAVSGLELPVPCDPARPVPIIAFHGTDDPILYFNGGVDSPSLTTLLGPDEPVAPPSTATEPARLDGPGVPATVQGWAVKDGCRPSAVDTAADDGVVLRRYRCPPGVAVQFTIVLGGGHAWPGSPVRGTGGTPAGTTGDQVDATAQLWDFFAQFRL